MKNQWSESLSWATWQIFAVSGFSPPATRYHSLSPSLLSWWITSSGVKLIFNNTSPWVFSQFIPWIIIEWNLVLCSLYDQSTAYAKYAFLTLSPASQQTPHYQEGWRLLHHTCAHSLFWMAGQIHANWSLLLITQEGNSRWTLSTQSILFC